MWVLPSQSLTRASSLGILSSPCCPRAARRRQSNRLSDTGENRMAAKKKATKKAPAKKKAAAKRKPNAAFMKAMQPSPQLSAVIGGNPMPRTEVTKKIWQYIKKNNLQDSKNKRNINADDKLKEVFGGKKQVSMFEMTKLV